MDSQGNHFECSVLQYARMASVHLEDTQSFAESSHIRLLQFGGLGDGVICEVSQCLQIPSHVQLLFLRGHLFFLIC